MVTLAVSFEPAQSKDSIFDQPTLSISVDTTQLSIEELITCTVRTQLMIRRAREQAKRSEYAENRFLTDSAIAAGRRSGRITTPRQPEQRYSDLPDEMQQQQIQQEINRALVAFNKKQFRILVDGQLHHNQDDQVIVSDVSQILFLRLTPLVGG